jgi:hypothetical protein
MKRQAARQTFEQMVLEKKEKTRHDVKWYEETEHEGKGHELTEPKRAGNDGRAIGVQGMIRHNMT